MHPFTIDHYCGRTHPHHLVPTCPGEWLHRLAIYMTFTLANACRTISLVITSMLEVVNSISMMLIYCYALHFLTTYSVTVLTVCDRYCDNKMMMMMMMFWC